MRALYWPTNKACALVPYVGAIEAEAGRRALIGGHHGTAEVDHDNVLVLDKRLLASPHLVLTIGHA